MTKVSKHIHIKGLVQGVGFRPFIYVLAHRFKLKGWVENRNDGVIIQVEGHEQVIDEFIQAISNEAPRASNIFELNIENCKIEDYKSFEIVKSENASEEVTEVSPDIAVCDKCIEDLKNQKHRINYPFINCTNCGPRFSIIKDLPYDRDKTTMHPFIMCPICKKEYKDIFDRRFHAQPVACNNCGPKIKLDLFSSERRAESQEQRAEGGEQSAESGELRAEGGELINKYEQQVTSEEWRMKNVKWEARTLKPVTSNLQPANKIEQRDTRNELRDTRETDFILSQCCDILESGKILAIKGMGGYHLSCDATNEEAVKNLRNKKIREGKPFAVMFSNLITLKKFAEVNEEEVKLLTSWRSPIVLLKFKKELAPSVSNGMQTIGAMLPYMPFHHLLFEKLNLPAIVLTSGNISDEPIILDNDIAIQELGRISDAVLTYNRDIHNRTDDSVAFVCNDKPRLIRRSRGYSPSPIYLQQNVEGIFAAGAELVNCFAIGKGQQAIMSQHIGDLKNLETLEFYEEAFHQFKKLFRFEPKLVARDLHPDYLSSKFADSLQLPTVLVQHHHAHIVSGMAENGLDEPVIGVAFDGTGLGDDGHIWGGEFFICNLSEYKRVSHFEYLPMPGGDLVTKETWRMGLSYLYQTFGRDLFSLDLNFIKDIGLQKVDLVLSAIDKKLNTPLTSSSGRLFDAVSAIIDLCPISKFHAEAPMRLESIINHETKECYHFDLGHTISFKKMIREIIFDIQQGIPKSMISAKFHNTIINSIFKTIKQIQNEYKVNKVILSGGTFQNRYLLERIENLLNQNNFKVYSQTKIPSNDGGIALGQIVIANSKIKKFNDYEKNRKI